MSIASVAPGGLPLVLPAPGRAGSALPTTAEHPVFPRLDRDPCAEAGQGFDLLEQLLTGGPAQVSVAEFLSRTLVSQLIDADALEGFLAQQPTWQDKDTAGLVHALLRQGLLTSYQVCRLLAGQTFGLVLGNYRLVERLAAGGMGVVYKAEHVHMKRAVAIKVIVSEDDRNSVFLRRFYSEMQATAVLSHPHIVLAFDAGEMAVPGSALEVMRYLVMEYVPGQDLEQYVLKHGRLPLAEACEYIWQAASGLQHAHEHGLVHRDIKPSNLLLTPQRQVKILDFGLARLGRRRHTEAHTMLGTVDYMAPEQARDARSVDIRADIYGLGGILYWLLAGQKPFPGDRPVIEELMARQRESPLPLHRLRSDIPLELEAIVYQMMAVDPSDRYASPRAVMAALSAFLEPTRQSAPGFGLPHQADGLDAEVGGGTPPLGETAANGSAPRLLLVSQSPRWRSSWRSIIESQGLELIEAGQVQEATEQIAQTPFDLILIDAQLPGESAQDLCSQLRAEPPAPHVKVLWLTPENSSDWQGTGQKAGADDQAALSMPAQELAGRVRLLLRLKESEHRADQLAGQFVGINQQLEQTQRLRTTDLYQTQDVLIFTMARMAELRGLETGGHLLRMQNYVRVLAEAAMRLPAFAGQLDLAYVRMVERCVLLHDIGKVAIPDHILLKPGKFDAEERSLMESHTVVGAEILAAVARQHGGSLNFLQMSTEIARHHHERYDGTGYPDNLAREVIPLSARLVTIADVYDALRCKLVYKPGLTHGPARRLILEAKPGQFDPNLLIAFRQCETDFEQIFAQTRD